VVRFNENTQEVDAVAVDLRELSFIDSSGLRALLNAQAELNEVGLRLAVIRGKGQVGEVLEATGIGIRLPVLDHLSELRLDPD
jgi:anti-anti-sigma factor